MDFLLVVPSISHFFTEKAISSIQQKALMRIHIATQTIFSLASFVVHMKSIRIVFGIEINSLHSHMPSQTCCRNKYFVTELTQITYRLLRKDLCNISLQLFAVMRSFMTSKSGFRQTELTRADVTKMFILKSLWNQS